MRWMYFFVFCLWIIPFAAGQNTAVSQPPAACGLDKVRFRVSTRNGTPDVPALPPDSARLYVIEDWLAELHTNPVLRIGIDGQWVGADQKNSWFTFSVPAGEHHLCVDWQGAFMYDTSHLGLYGLKVEPGYTYYFRAYPRGFYQYEILLEPLNIDEAHYLLSIYPQAIATPKK